MTILVAVVSYNSERLIPDLIAGLRTGLDGLKWHLTVADNDSRDNSVALVRELAPEATVVEMGRNAGYAAGINAAVAASPSYDAILVLNPDVRLTPGCVPRLLEALEVPGTGIAVPNLVDGDGVLIHTQRREPSTLRMLGDAFLGARRAGRSRLLGEIVTTPSAYEAETCADWAEGSTQLISAECFARIGPWDERYFLYSEETDFALRARDAGLRTRYVPEAKAVHLEGDSRVSPGLWALLTLNKVRLHRRRHGALRASAFWAATVLRESSRAALGKKPSRAATRDLLTPSRLREKPGPASVARWAR
ncbi:glycosyl transferase family 2 [Actinoplanes cyaneus]|uniref:Glycosyl transferase family 2 n=1 Tax=Actinoplanes cyaneus TaxID=52696 RepID=A0A919IHZ3_9ACTN|nr:glycosyltransferase family 2 protein [Actinoplanes cyaneus]MCW2142683.1 Glycosyltransferase, GT2 family [Actinoplanes cyaneus]GID62230.1 glycosyl transferase family 2 [Actinoplanes cyaneus]